MMKKEKKLNRLIQSIFASTNGFGLVGSILGAGISIGAITYFLESVNVSKNYESRLRSSVQMNQKVNQISKLFDSPEICFGFLTAQAGGSTPLWSDTATELEFNDLTIGGEKILGVNEKIGLYNVSSIKLIKKADLGLVNYSGIDYKKHLLNLEMIFHEIKSPQKTKTFSNTEVIILINSLNQEVVKCYAKSFTSGNLETICEGFGGDYNPILDYCNKACSSGEYLESISGAVSDSCKPLPAKNCDAGGKPGQQIYNGDEYGPCIELPSVNPRTWRHVGSAHTGGYGSHTYIYPPVLDPTMLNGLSDCPSDIDNAIHMTTGSYAYGRGQVGYFAKIANIISGKVICQEDNNYRCKSLSQYVNRAYYYGNYVYFKLIFDCKEN